jgi:hypothetical protein
VTRGRWRGVLRMRTRSLLFRNQLERELEKELRFHMDLDAEEARVWAVSRRSAARSTKKNRRNHPNSGGMPGYAQDEFH